MRIELRDREAELAEMRRQLDLEKATAKRWKLVAQRKAQEGSQAAAQVAAAQRREEQVAQREQAIVGQVVQGGVVQQQREIALQQGFEDAKRKIEEEASRHVDALHKQYLSQLGTTHSALWEQAQAHILGFQRESQEAKYRA